jgi:outer membrane receptor protein involved in Fe transport
MNMTTSGIHTGKGARGPKVLFTCLLVWSNVGLCAGETEAPPQPIDLTALPFETLVNTEVFSASKLAKQVSESHTAVSIVTAEDIRTHGYQTLADVIGGMRGLFTTYDRRYQYISGRGNGAAGNFTGRLMVLLDGLSVQDNLYNQAYVGHDGLVDLELVERVEYIPGPGSVAHGNNALLGVINVITKKGADLNATQVATEWMSRGGKKQRITHGQRLANGADVLLSVSRMGSDGQPALYFPYFDAVGQSHGVARNLDAEHGTRLLGKFAFEGLSLQAAWATRDKLVPYVPSEHDQRFNLFRQLKDTSGFVSARYDATLSAQLKSSTQVYTASYENGGMFEYEGSQPKAQYLKSRIGGRWWGLDQTFVSNAWAGHTLVWGGGYRRDDKQQYSWDLYTADRTFSYVDPDAYDYTTRLLNLFVADDYALSDQVRLNAGLRYDRATIDDCSVAPCRTHAMPVQWSPRLAVAFTPTAHTSWKFSYSRSFRLPTANDMPILGRDRLHQVARVNLTEAVVLHDLTPLTRLTGSLYSFGVSGEYLVDALTGRPDYNARARTSGAEVQVDTETAQLVRLRASLAWQLARDHTGAQQVNSPHTLAKLLASVPVADSRFRIGLETLWVGTRLTSPLRDARNVAVAPARRLGGYGLVNLTVSSQAKWHGWALSAGVKNLFNRRYESAVRSSFPVASPSGVVFDSVLVGDRTLWLQLSFDHWN